MVVGRVADTGKHLITCTAFMKRETAYVCERANPREPLKGAGADSSVSMSTQLWNPRSDRDIDSELYMITIHADTTRTILSRSLPSTADGYQMGDRRAAGQQPAKKYVLVFHTARECGGDKRDSRPPDFRAVRSTRHRSESVTKARKRGPKNMVQDRRRRAAYRRRGIADRSR